MLTDGKGVPLVVQTTPANVNDDKQLPALLDAVPAVQGPRGRPRQKLGCLFGDKMYGTKEQIAGVRERGIYSFLSPRTKTDHGSGLGVSQILKEICRRLIAFKLMTP